MNSQTEYLNRTATTVNNPSFFTSRLLTKSLITFITGALFAATLSFGANAEEPRKHIRSDKDRNHTVSVRIDNRAKRKHADRSSVSQQEVKREKSQKTETKNVHRQHQSVTHESRSRKGSAHLTDSGQIKARIKQQQQQIRHLQKQQKKQQKQQHKFLHKKTGGSAIEKKFSGTNSGHHKGSVNQGKKSKYVQHDRAKHRAYPAHRNGHRYLNARYNYNHRQSNVRVFGNHAYQSLGLIYSYHHNPAYIEYRYDTRFVWDRVKSFYSPKSRRGYHGEELVIKVDERVQTIKLKGLNRRMIIDAAYVEFGNGEVRRIPEFEGTLFENDVINFHLQDSRYVAAVYLDVAANEGKRGKASISVLKSRSRH